MLINLSYSLKSVTRNALNVRNVPLVLARSSLFPGKYAPLEPTGRLAVQLPADTLMDRGR